MANEMIVPFVGNLTADPEARVTNGGKTMVTGSIVHKERIFDRQTNSFKDGEPNFFDLTMFSPDADHALASYKKGTRVVGIGKLRIRQFERKDGSRGTSASITVIEMGRSTKFEDIPVSDGNQSGGFQQNGGYAQNNGYQQPQNNGGSQDPWSGQQAAHEDPFTNAAPPEDYGQPQGGNNDAFAGW